MAMRRCLGCTQLIPTGSRCPACKPKDRRRGRGQTYGQAEYRRNRALILTGDPACVYCGQPATTADHLTPVSLGGTHDLTNLAPACARCNSSKGNRQHP